jgi:hypothetical protein
MPSKKTKTAAKKSAAGNAKTIRKNLNNLSEPGALIF